MKKLHAVRMWVTEGCNASCHFCMNASGRKNGVMDVDRFKCICDYLKKNDFDKVFLMGGEPTIHPFFGEICHIAQDYFQTVYLFTNALCEEPLLQFHPRENDIVIYNASFLHKITPNKLLLSYPGKRIIDVVITTSDFNLNYVEDIVRAYRLSPERISVQLVIDSICNVFREKKILLENLNNTYTYLRGEGVNASFECGLPVCFTYGEKLPDKIVKKAKCDTSAILIDSHFNLRLCNVHSDILVNLFNGDKLIPYQIVKNYIEMAKLQNQLASLKKICRKCILYDTTCNGKCHIPLSTIKMSDIVENTKLPWLWKGM